MQQRSTAERGWRLAALLLLGVIAFFWMPLGVRDAGGVSSVIPALRPVSESRPDRPDRPTEARPHDAARRALTAARRLVTPSAPVLRSVALVVVGLLVVVSVAPPRAAALGAPRLRGPPSLV